MKKLLNLILSLSIVVSGLSSVVYAEMTEYTGQWLCGNGALSDYIITDEDTVTLRIPNSADDGKGSGKVKWKADNRTEIDYVLDTPVENGTINISYEFKANGALGAVPRASEIRFTASENENADYIMSVVNAVSHPYIYQGPSGMDKFSSGLLSAGISDDDEWHTAEYIFYAEDSVLNATRVLIDGEDVNGEFSYNKNSDITSIKAVEFWFFGNTTNTADYEMKIRNMKVTSGVEDITITSDIENGATDVQQKNFTLNFSHAVTDSVYDALTVLDADGEEVLKDKYSVSFADDAMSITVSVSASKEDSNKSYTIKLAKDVLTGQKNEKLIEDYLLSFTFGEIAPIPDLIIKSDITDGSVNVIPSNMKFNIELENGEAFLLNENSFDEKAVKLNDEDNNEVLGVNAVLSGKTLVVKADECEPNTKYTLTIGKNFVKGMNGESLADDYTVSFTTSIKTSVAGEWKNTYDKHPSDFNDDGSVITINVSNDGTAGAQATRDAYTYTFAETVTGTNVPIKVSFKFKANEALTASESHIRFYPYDNGDRGGGNICLDFAYTKPQFRWDGVKFNLPDNVTSLTADEWHEAEYLLIVDSENGLSMINGVIDGTVTEMDYKKSAVKQLGCVDFWFYMNSVNTGDYELQLKDFQVLQGADIITVISSIEDGSTDVEAKDMKITFSQPVTFVGDIKEAISIVNENNEIINSEKYTVVMNYDNTVASITMNTDDLDSKKIYKIYLDKTQIYGKRYEVIEKEMFISFTLPEILPKATLGFSPGIPYGSTDITPSEMKFNIVPLPNDRISDVSDYEIMAASNTDISKAVKVYNSDESEATQIICTAQMLDSGKAFSVTLQNYERYTQYKIKFLKDFIIGENGELMKEDYIYSFTTGETEKPPYIEHGTEFNISWHGQTTYTTDEKTGITTFNYKNSVAQGNSGQRTEMGWYLDTPITNSEGPVVVSYEFQANEALTEATGGQAFNVYVSNSNAQGSLTHRNAATKGDITDWSRYIEPYTGDEHSTGITDADKWHKVQYIMNVDNGKVTNSYVQVDDYEPVNISSIKSSVNNIGLLQFRFYSYPNADGVYEDYVLRVKNVSIRSMGALKGSVTVNSPTSLGLRFSYDVPVMFGNDIVISELRDGEYQEIKQSYTMHDMDSSDMKQINVTIGDGGLCYNTDYRVTVLRDGMIADEYVKLKQTDIDFKTKEYPDNTEAQLDEITKTETDLSFDCTIKNISSADTMNGAYVLIGAYSESGELLGNYCEVIPTLNPNEAYIISDITLNIPGASKIKVFIFEDDKSFKLYHYPQIFAVKN